jgi:hypothetical protein
VGQRFLHRHLGRKAAASASRVARANRRKSSNRSRAGARQRHRARREGAGLAVVERPQHFVHSKVMAWAAFDRAANEAPDFAETGSRWREIADEIHAEICQRGFDRDLDSFVQAYGPKRLDASPGGAAAREGANRGSRARRGPSWRMRARCSSTRFAP